MLICESYVTGALGLVSLFSLQQRYGRGPCCSTAAAAEDRQRLPYQGCLQLPLATPRRHAQDFSRHYAAVGCGLGRRVCVAQHDGPRSFDLSSARAVAILGQRHYPRTDRLDALLRAQERAMPLATSYAGAHPWGSSVLACERQRPFSHFSPVTGLPIRLQIICAAGGSGTVHRRDRRARMRRPARLYRDPGADFKRCRVGRCAVQLFGVETFSLLGELLQQWSRLPVLRTELRLVSEQRGG